MATPQVDIQNNFDEVTSGLRDVVDELKNVRSAQEDTNSAVEAGTETTQGLSKGFSGVGLAIKAAGIGLAIEAFNFLKDALSESQIATDFFTTAFNAASRVVNDFITFITNNVGRITDFFEAFSLPSISDIGTAIQENLTERFESALEVVGFLGEAFSRLIRGDVSGALDSLEEAGKELVDTFTGVDNTFDRVVETVTSAASAVVDYTTSVISAAVAQTSLANTALVAAAMSALLRAENEAQQESLRQTRDDTRLTIEARLEASRLLGESVERDLIARESLAQAGVAAAEQALENNASIENQVALLEAQAVQVEVLAEVEGRRSEQQASQIGLELEQIEILQAAKDEAADADQKRRDDEVALEEAKQRALEQLQDAQIDAASALGDALTTLAGDNKGLAIAGLIVEQSAAIAGIVIDTLRANAAAVAASPLTAGQPFVTINSITGGLSVAAAIAAAVQGIQQINQSPGPSVSGSAGAGGASSVPFGPTVSTPLMSQTDQQPSMSDVMGMVMSRPVEATIQEGPFTQGTRNITKRNQQRQFKRRP